MLNFYRVYHSMRYVRGDLVLRLQRRLSERLLERDPQRSIADILEGGHVRADQRPAGRSQRYPPGRAAAARLPLRPRSISAGCAS